MLRDFHPIRRGGLSHWAVVAFLAIFILLLLAVARWFLFPAVAAAQHATQAERHRLAAYSWLLLVVVLFVLLVSMILIFHVGRFFFPGKTSSRTKTTYVDAWKESGKRMEIPPEE